MNEKNPDVFSNFRRMWSYPGGKFFVVAMVGGIVVALVALFMGQASNAFQYAKFLGMAITMAAGVWFFIRATSGRNY